MRRGLVVALLSSSIFSATADDLINKEVVETLPDVPQAGDLESGLFVASLNCGTSFLSCVDAGPCFDHSMGCAEDGSIIFQECSAALPFCKPCFPNSRCASDAPSDSSRENENVPDTPQESDDDSALFVESETCGPTFASCAEAANCFDHSLGCAKDGSMIFPQCSTAIPFCKSCFPNSRCGSDEENLSGVFVESESCGPEFATCVDAAPCFDHFMGCAEDGSIIFPECSPALPFCNPCFPNSRCASSESSISAPREEGDDASGLFVESETCGPTFASCAEAAPCFDHSMGCAEDGSIIFPECSTALPFCNPCFPNSRCSSGSTFEEITANKVEIDEVTDEESPNGNISAEEESLDTDTSAMEMMSGAHRSGVATVILSLVAAGISWY